GEGRNEDLLGARAALASSRGAAVVWIENEAVIAEGEQEGAGRLLAQEVGERRRGFIRQRVESFGGARPHLRQSRFDGVELEQIAGSGLDAAGSARPSTPRAARIEPASVERLSEHRR